MMLDSGHLDLRSDMPLKEQVQALMDYVLNLNRQLQYVLQNIDTDNLGAEMAQTITQVKAAAKAFEHKVSDEDYTSFVRQTAKSFEMRVHKDQIISMLNLSPEEIKIMSDKIRLEGAVTVNGYFKIDAEGRVIATGGRIGGWTLDDKGLYAGYNTEEVSPSLYLGTADILKPAAVAQSGDRKDWRLKIGANFGVTADGTPYMRGGSLTGTTVDTDGIDGYTELAATVNEFRQNLLNTLTLNAVIVSSLRVGTTEMALKQITAADGQKVTVLAAV